MIWIVIRILYPQSNPDHPRNLIECSFSRNTPLVFYANPFITFEVIRRTDRLTDGRTDGRTDQQDQKHIIPGGGNSRSVRYSCSRNKYNLVSTYHENQMSMT